MLVILFDGVQWKDKVLWVILRKTEQGKKKKKEGKH